MSKALLQTWSSSQPRVLDKHGEAREPAASAVLGQISETCLITQDYRIPFSPGAEVASLSVCRAFVLLCFLALGMRAAGRCAFVEVNNLGL